MKTLKSLLFGMLATLVLVPQAQASLINISLNPDDWIPNDAYGWDAWTANYTKGTVGGNLRITRTVAQGGTGWAAHMRTGPTYAFTAPGMLTSTFQYKWRVNGLGTYSHTSGGPQPLAGGSGFPFWGPTDRLCTGWSFMGCPVVPDDTWLYTQLIINNDHSWTATTSYAGYGLGSSITEFSGILSALNYDALNDMYLRHSIADNYAAGQYFEIAEATIQIVSAVPEPATFALMALGLVGLGFQRKKRA